MPSLKKKSHKPVRVPRARNAHSRQRQRLIDACISALHIYGPSRTTVEKVVAIAKMSPGIVRFYFASKAAMLVASLQFLSTEFEEQLLGPVTRLKARPVAALELMVDLYLDPEIASPRKVSVWYAFWGEASSRQEYYDICGQKDEGFAALVRELIERLIIETSQAHLDPDGIALGLIGVLEMLWQDFAFRSEADIDRAAAKRRAMAYLRSVFPGQFAGSHAAAAGAAGTENDARRSDARHSDARHFAGWVYADQRLFALERESLFQDSWQFVGHEARVPSIGNFLTVDLGFERALVVRDAAGEVRAFRNSCPESPHILVAGDAGHVDLVRCAVHGLAFDLNGTRRAACGSGDLAPLDLRLIGPFMLLRLPKRNAESERAADPWEGFSPPPGLRPLAPAGMSPPQTGDIAAAADWKLLAEQWLESMSAATARDAPSGWSASSYRRLVDAAAPLVWPQRFFGPNHLLQSRSDGLTILQVLPTGPGRSTIRRHDFTSCKSDPAARAAQYLASRLSPFARRSAVSIAESTQRGIVIFGHGSATAAKSAPEAADFRRRLTACVPMLGLRRPPNEI